MLDILNREIEKFKLDTTSFENRFQQHVIETQDQNINEEILFLVKHHISPIQLDQLSAQTYKGW